MSDRDLIIKLINKIKQSIIYETSNSINIENPCYGEDISFNFDDDGNLLSIYS